MNYTTTLKRAKSALLWVYKSITNKFTSLYSKLEEWFPVLNRNPVLKYSMIPVLLGLFFLLRYIIKFVIGELAAWTSGFVGETSGFIISERAIVISIAALLIILRLGFKLKSQKNNRSNEIELNNEIAK